MKNLLIAFCLLFACTGCEKIVDLNYQDNQSKIIIEGNISDKPGPYFVKISRSLPISEIGTNPTIDDAVITINDDAGNIETLIPEGNGLYSTQTLTGVEEHTYTLTAIIDDKTYIARSTMPRHIPFDSIKLENIKVLGETEYNIIPVYTDPIEKGNNYRFELTVNNIFIQQHFVQNNNVKNGTVNNSRLEINDDDLKLKSGDIISVTMQCVDTNVARYYTALALMTDSGPGGGTTPNNPPNNISNGALGLFSAHTTETITVTIP